MSCPHPRTRERWACTPQSVLAVTGPLQIFPSPAMTLWACVFLWLKVFPLGFLWHNQGLAGLSLLQRRGNRGQGGPLATEDIYWGVSQSRTLITALLLSGLLQLLLNIMHIKFLPRKTGFLWKSLKDADFYKETLDIEIFFYTFVLFFIF